MVVRPPLLRPISHAGRFWTCACHQVCRTTPLPCLWFSRPVTILILNHNLCMTSGSRRNVNSVAYAWRWTGQCAQQQRRRDGRRGLSDALSVRAIGPGDDVELSSQCACTMLPGTVHCKYNRNRAAAAAAAMAGSTMRAMMTEERWMPQRIGTWVWAAQAVLWKHMIRFGNVCFLYVFLALTMSQGGINIVYVYVRALGCVIRPYRLVIGTGQKCQGQHCCTGAWPNAKD
jgi:hypothetical protein